MRNYPAQIMGLFLALFPGGGDGLATIEPGVGFVSRKNGERVVIFEHTEVGTGGLVWNRPTPVLLGDLNIPRFHTAFKNHSLMLGCGTESTGSEMNIPIGDISPWFWLHNVPDLEGSSWLEGAKRPLFMGGNIDIATELFQTQQLDQARHKFKFFWKYKSWMGNDLLDEITAGVWEQVEPQDPDDVLQPYSIAISR